VVARRNDKFSFLLFFCRSRQIIETRPPRRRGLRLIRGTFFIKSTSQSLRRSSYPQKVTLRYQLFAVLYLLLCIAIMRKSRMKSQTSCLPLGEGAAALAAPDEGLAAINPL